MTTATRPQRLCNFIPADSAHFLGHLAIAEGKRRDLYAVALLETDFGTGYRLVKVAGGTDKESEYYDVLLQEDSDICDCKGHQMHGRCKHASALRALATAGRI